MTKSKGIRKRYPENLKRQAVLDMDSGDYTAGQVMEKYGIQYSSSLKEWGCLYSVNPSKYSTKPKISKSIRLKAVNEILSGYLTIEEAANKYLRSVNGIKQWIRSLSSEVLTLESEIAPLEETVVEESMTQEETNRLKELEKLLKFERLKVLGLETMIDIAERTYKLDIRKKFGSKQ